MSEGDIRLVELVKRFGDTVAVNGIDLEVTPQRAATFEGLNGVAAHLRGRVGRALRLRAAPEIEFRNDESIAHAAHIEQLLAQVRRDLPDQGADAPAPAQDEGRDD